MSKISLSGNPSGTGTFTIASPNSNTDRTVNLPDAGGDMVLTTATQTLTNKSIATTQLTGRVPAANAPLGSVIQVVQSVKTDTASTTSTGFGDVSGLSVAITPSSASSRILVLLQLGGIGNTSNAIRFNILRNSTLIAQPDSGSFASTVNVFPGGGTGIFNSGICWLDSPSTTSSTTYKVQWAVDAGTGVLNRHTGNTNYNSVSSITVMEIAA